MYNLFMIIKETGKGKKNIVILCGVHGDETHSVKMCYDLYLQLKNSRDYKYVFIFLANENALNNNTRCFVDKPENRNLNRIVKKETFESLQEQVLETVNKYKPIALMDVHNSPSCNKLVLIDYGEYSKSLYEAADRFNINPMLRPKCQGTIKDYAINTLKIPAYTVEASPMFNEYMNDQTSTYLQNVLDALKYAAKNFKKEIETSWLVSKQVYSPMKALVYWKKNNPYCYYAIGDTVCTLIDLETEKELVITAETDMVIQDINRPDVAFAGDMLFEYSYIPD